MKTFKTSMYTYPGLEQQSIQLICDLYIIVGWGIRQSTHFGLVIMFHQDSGVTKPGPTLAWVSADS